MNKNIKHSKKSEQYNVLTLKPYRSGNLTKLSESSRNNGFSSNLWGTNKQILLLKGRVKKDEEGTWEKGAEGTWKFEAKEVHVIVSIYAQVFKIAPNGNLKMIATIWNNKREEAAVIYGWKKVK